MKKYFINKLRRKVVVVLMIFLMAASSFGSIVNGIENYGAFRKTISQDKTLNQNIEDSRTKNEISNFQLRKTQFAGYWHEIEKQQKNAKSFYQAEGEWNPWKNNPNCIEASQKSGSCKIFSMEIQFHR